MPLSPPLKERRVARALHFGGKSREGAVFMQPDASRIRRIVKRSTGGDYFRTARSAEARQGST